jgi:hypothetical protein
MTVVFLSSPHINLPVAILSELAQRFKRASENESSKSAEAAWECSGWQHGPHIDSLPLQC